MRYRRPDAKKTYVPARKLAAIFKRSSGGGGKRRRKPRRQPRPSPKRRFQLKPRRARPKR